MNDFGGFPRNAVLLLATILCSCGNTEYVQRETVYRDTTVVVPVPALVDTLVFERSVYRDDGSLAIVPSGGSGAPGPQPVRKVTGRHGVTLTLNGKTAIVEVPKDSVAARVSYPSQTETHVVDDRTWMQKQLEGVPLWVVVLLFLAVIGAFWWRRRGSN